MSRLILFFKRYRNTFLFVTLHILFGYVYISHNSYANIVYQESIFDRARFFIGSLIKSGRYYVSLFGENDRLRNENERLRNALQENFLAEYTDSLGKNTYHISASDLNQNYPKLTLSKQMEWVQVNIVQKIVKAGHSFFIINVGGDKDLQEGMPLFGHVGLAGTIIKVYEHYAVVSNLFNVDFAASAKVGLSGSAGILRWNVNAQRTLTLKEIPLMDSAQIGDTIYTSHLSYLFPHNLPIGVVKEMRPIDRIYSTLQIVPIERLDKLYTAYVVKATPIKNKPPQELP